MKRTYLFLLLSLFSGAFAGKKKHNQSQMTKMLMPLTGGEKIQLAQHVQNIKALCYADKVDAVASCAQWSSCVRSDVCIDDFIQTVAGALQMHPMDVAWLVRTPQATKWIRDQRKSYPEIQWALDSCLLQELSQGSEVKSEKVKKLLSAGADIRVYPAALHNAIRANDCAMISFLVKKYRAAGMDITNSAMHIYGQSPLMYAHYSDHHVMDYLLKTKVKPAAYEQIVSACVNYKNLRTDERGWPLATFQKLITSGLGTQEDLAHARQKVAEAQKNKAYMTDLGPQGVAKLDAISALLEQAHKDAEQKNQ